MTSPRSPRLSPASQSEASTRASGDKLLAGRSRSGRCEGRAGGELGGWQRVPQRAGRCRWPVLLSSSSPSHPNLTSAAPRAETRESQKKGPGAGKKTNPTPPLVRQSSSPPLPGSRLPRRHRGEGGWQSVAGPKMGRTAERLQFTRPSGSTLSDCMGATLPSELGLALPLLSSLSALPMSGRVRVWIVHIQEKTTTTTPGCYISHRAKQVV